MGLLDELLGGGQQQQAHQDFIDRYSQGAPHDGIGDEETAQRYGQVAGEVDPDTYQQSAQESLQNMTEDQRGQYAQQLGSAADQQGVAHGWDGASTDPESLAQMTSNVHQQSPGLLSSLLGGGAMGGAGGGGELGALGGLLAGAGGGAGLGGLLGGAGGGGGLGGLLGGAGGGGSLGGLLGGAGGGAAAGGNPVMRAALGGIAAMAARKMMGGGGRASGLF